MTPLYINDLPLDGIKAVVFDLDGTLYDCKNIAFWLCWHDIPNMLTLGAERVIRKRMRGVECESAEAFYARYFEGISRLRRIPPERVRKWFCERFMPLFGHVLHKHYKADKFAVPLLKALREKGLKLALLSDYAYAEDKLRILGIDPQLFDILIAAPDNGGLKPCTKPFLHTLQLIGVQPHEALMIGDKPHADGAGAINIGMKYLQV